MTDSDNANLFQRIYSLVQQVPAGRVVTYGQVAAALGSRRLARTVGWAMRACPHDVPWHRVINSQGKVSTPRITGTANLQRALLEDEGVQFGLDGRVSLQQYGYGFLPPESASEARR
jgi:methylated-DNA-protein-cysteine methyltransferase related protein